MTINFAAEPYDGKVRDFRLTSGARLDPQRRGLVKAKELLARRGIMNTLRSMNLSATRTEEYCQGLLRLQAAIFDLDYYGEENWTIDRRVLNHHWLQIEAAADALRSNLVPELEAIRAYQRIELATRSGNPVARVPIHVFYRLKSCDVWLMQKFLSKVASCEGLQMCNSMACHVLNIIQEIKDDLDDIIEDTPTYNGNRIISMCVTYGYDKTLHEYRDFLLGLIRHARQEFAEIRSNCDGNSRQTWIDAIETATALIAEINSQDTSERLSFAESRLSVTHLQSSVA